jgi:hypothetical protein
VDKERRLDLSYSLHPLPLEEEEMNKPEFEKVAFKHFEIWAEGYAATGESGRAIKMGEADGKDFKNACVNFAEKNDSFKKFFNPQYMNYWGCRLFDNEADARKSFG